MISTEYLKHKVKEARKNIADAELNDCVKVLKGDASATVKDVTTKWNFVLLDGWPDMVFTIFKLIEPHLKKAQS